MTVDLAALYTFLGMDERDGPRDLLYAARIAHYTLPYLVLSAVERDGGPMGAASADELARARERADTYDRLLAGLVDVAGASVLKGPLLARLYPPGLLRAQGDIDVAVADEPRLWRGVRWLLEREPVTEFRVSTFGRDPRHVMVSVIWDAADNLSDPPYRVEISTAALTGDFGAVPVRVALPPHPQVAALLALAEERLQRDFHVRDLIDVAVLGEAEFPAVPQLLAIVEEYRLAPEVAELLTRAADVHPLGSLTDLSAALRPLVEREQQRRRTYSPPVPDASDHPVLARLAAGGLLYGMELRRTGYRPNWTVSRVRAGAEGAILLTPVGDYMLVADATVDPEAYERARGELDRLETVATA